MTNLQNTRFTNYLIDCTVHGIDCPSKYGILPSANKSQEIDCPCKCGCLPSANKSHRRKIEPEEVQEVTFRGKQVFFLKVKGGMRIHNIQERYPEEHGFRLYVKKGKATVSDGLFVDEDIIEVSQEFFPRQARRETVTTQGSLLHQSKKIRKARHTENTTSTFSISSMVDRPKFNYFFPAHKQTKNTRAGSQTSYSIFPEGSKPMEAFEYILDRLDAQQESMEKFQARTISSEDKIREICPKVHENAINIDKLIDHVGAIQENIPTKWAQIEERFQYLPINQRIKKPNSSNRSEVISHLQGTSGQI